MRLKKYLPLLWIVLGAVYGLAGRLILRHAPPFLHADVVSFAFLVGTPIAIGAIVIYGIRASRPSILRMLFLPWIAILLALAGSAITLIEGTICIVMAAPLFLIAASIGGLMMGLTLRWTRRGRTTINSILVLPVALMLVEPVMTAQPQLLEERVSIVIAAPPHRIWQEIMNARDIRREELTWNFTHWIGVPRPVEGVNVMTSEGEVRYSKWERGVNFTALVTERVEDRHITWHYHFTPTSFPAGSMDEHVKIGGKYFDLDDTTFNLAPISATSTTLEIVSHYRVTTDINFYGVPVARFIARDFMSTILQLYKTRSERDTG